MKYLGTQVQVNIGYKFIHGKVVEELDDKVCVRDFLGTRHWFDKDRIRQFKGGRKRKVKWKL